MYRERQQLARPRRKELGLFAWVPLSTECALMPIDLSPAYFLRKRGERSPLTLISSLLPMGARC